VTASLRAQGCRIIEVKSLAFDALVVAVLLKEIIKSDSLFFQMASPHHFHRLSFNQSSPHATMINMTMRLHPVGVIGALLGRASAFFITSDVEPGSLGAMVAVGFGGEGMEAVPP
jgi:hypothetical protein